MKKAEYESGIPGVFWEKGRETWHVSITKDGKKTYLGRRKKLEDAVWEVYLSKDDHTFIVREKSVVDTNYRVESIKPPTLTLTYLPLNQMQTLSIGGAD